MVITTNQRCRSRNGNADFTVTFFDRFPNYIHGQCTIRYREKLYTAFAFGFKKRFTAEEAVQVQ